MNMNKVDVRTWIIVLMAAVIVCMSIFGKGGSNAALETLLKQREDENKAAEERIEQRGDTINMYKDSAKYYMKEDQLKAEIIDALQEVQRKQKRDIEALKKKLNEVPQQVEDATDQERIEWWREYFRRKGIKL